MGFDELGRTSMKNNLSLIRSTMSKYFRNEKGLATGEKTELSPSRKRVADNARKRQINVVLLLFVLIVVLCVLILTWILS